MEDENGHMDVAFLILILVGGGGWWSSSLFSPEEALGSGPR